MAFDFKKEYKEFYMPKARPEIVTVPKMNYIAVEFINYGVACHNVEYTGFSDTR